MISADGSVWVVTNTNQIYRWTGSDWSQVSGGLKNVSVGSENLVWGVGPTGSVYSSTAEGWIQKPGKLKQISVAADGTKWGVTDANKIYRWESNGIADADRIVSNEMLERRWPNGIIPFRFDPEFADSRGGGAVGAAFIAEVRAGFFGSTTIPGCTTTPCIGWDAADAVRFIDCESTGNCGQYKHTVYLIGNYEENQTKDKRGYAALLKELPLAKDCTLAGPENCRQKEPCGGSEESCVFDIWLLDKGNFMWHGPHELGHMLGFMHEQGRPDRDQFIDASDCPPVDEEKYAAKYFIGTYDVKSVMHYDTVNDCFSDLPGMPPILTYSNHDLPSPKDLAKLQLLYGVRGDWLTNTDWCAADVQKIHVGDFNGNGRQDLLCHSTDSGRVWIDYADIDGRFNGTDASDNSQYCVGSKKQVLVADYNGDGKDDALCHDRSTGQVGIDYADSQGRIAGQNWPSSGLYNLSICNNSDTNLYVGDFNGDGRTDLLCHNTHNGDNELAYVNSVGRFTGIQWKTPGSGWCSQPEILVVGDFNGDGRSDALCHKPGEGHRKIDFVFSNNVVNATNWDSRSHGAGAFCSNIDQSLHVADINGDGRDDLLCHDLRIGSVSIDLANVDHGIGWKQGSGLWGSDLVYDLAFCNAQDGRLLLGAFNGQDSRADLLCHNKQTGHKATLITRPGGIFVIPPDY